MIFPFVVPPAAFEAGDSTFHCMHSRECGAAFATGIEIFSFKANAFEREIVTSGFVWDSQIAAGMTPLGAVRSNVPASGTMLREKVGKLMTQRSLNFGRRHLDELRIEGYRPGPPAGESGGRPEPRFPFDDHLELRTSGCTQELAAKLFQTGCRV